jgi:hypothetical protein
LQLGLPVETGLNCSICKSEILKGKQTYVLRIDLFAAPDELEISKEEMEKDRRTEFEKLMEQLEAMDAEAVEEETDKVFERHVYMLCPICRARFHGLLRDVRTAKEGKGPPPTGK